MRWGASSDHPQVFPRARRCFDPKGMLALVECHTLNDDSVPGRVDWRAAIRTDWAKRIDKLTEGCDWILRLYRSYTPA